MVTVHHRVELLVAAADTIAHNARVRDSPVSVHARMCVYAYRYRRSCVYITAKSAVTNTPQARARDTTRLFAILIAPDRIPGAFRIFRSHAWAYRLA